MDDTDKFPNPPTETEWQILIEDLEAAGEIKSHPNGRYFLPKENPPSRQINFHGQGIYNEQPNQGTQSLRDKSDDSAIPNPTPTSKTQIRIGVWGLIIAVIGIIVMIILDVI